MAAYPKLRSKSGMGTDIDPVRLILAILAFGAAVYAGRGAHSEWLSILPIVAVVFGVLLGWWTTRNSYLDKIAVKEHFLQELAEKSDPKIVQRLQAGEGELALQAGWNVAAREAVSFIQDRRPDIEMETASGICRVLGQRLPR